MIRTRNIFDDMHYHFGFGLFYFILFSLFHLICLILIISYFSPSKSASRICFALFALNLEITGGPATPCVCHANLQFTHGFFLSISVFQHK